MRSEVSSCLRPSSLVLSYLLDDAVGTVWAIAKVTGVFLSVLLSPVLVKHGFVIKWVPDQVSRKRMGYYSILHLMRTELLLIIKF